MAFLSRPLDGCWPYPWPDTTYMKVREGLAALGPLWAELLPAEQARIIQLLIERVDIGTNGLKLRFRDKGLAQMVAEVGIMNGKGQKAA